MAEEPTCPCCGRAMSVAPGAEALSSLPLGPSEREVLGYYVAQYPRSLPNVRIIGQLWQLDPNGGPTQPRNGLGVRVHHINRALRPLGWRIQPHGRDARQLVRLDA
jgi:hypothetical protein